MNLSLIVRRVLLGALGVCLLLGGRGECEHPALLSLREAEEYAAQGAHTAAAQAYRTAIEGLREPYPALRLAQLYLAWNRPQDARAALAEAQRYGASAEAIEELSLAVLAALQAWDEAYPLAQAHLATHPQSHTAWQTLISALLAYDNCEEARVQSAAWRAALPDDAEAQRLWALLHFQSDFSAARTALCAVDEPLCLILQQCALRDQCELRLGSALVQRNENALALCLLRPFVAATPQQAEGHAWTGAALIRRGRYSEGERSLQRALQLNPQLPLAWTLLGLLQLQQADYTNAETSLFKAHQLDPGNPALCLAMARLYALQGAYDQVDTWANAALDRAGADATVWHSVARFYLERGQQGAVLERALQGALKQAPLDAQTALLHGWAALLQGDARSARAWLDRALTFNPTSGEAWYLRGLARQRLGEAAQEDFIRAQDLGYWKP